MRVALSLLVLLLVLAVAGAGWLFWVQNSAQQVVPSFELWGVGRYGARLSLSQLVASAAGIGALLGLGIGGLLTAAFKNRRIRALDAQLRGGGTERSW